MIDIQEIDNEENVIEELEAQYNQLHTEKLEIEKEMQRIYNAIIHIKNGIDKN